MKKLLLIALLIVGVFSIFGYLYWGNSQTYTQADNSREQCKQQCKEAFGIDFEISKLPSESPLISLLDICINNCVNQESVEGQDKIARELLKQLDN